MKKYLKKKNKLILVHLKIYNYFKTTVEENRNQEFRLKNVDETRNYLI